VSGKAKEGSGERKVKGMVCGEEQREHRASLQFFLPQSDRDSYFHINQRAAQHFGGVPIPS